MQIQRIISVRALIIRYKYFLRENTKIKYTPPLNKNAIALLRRTMKKASRKGIHIVASVKKFENPSTKLIDIRNVVQMFKDWDVGLTVPELETIRDLLDNDADCKLDSFEILQYNHQLFDSGLTNSAEINNSQFRTVISYNLIF